jgi:hypothetical protein
VKKFWSPLRIVNTVQSVAAFAKLGETAALEARHRFEERAGQVLEEVKAVNVRLSIDRCQVLQQRNLNFIHAREGRHDLKLCYWSTVRHTLHARRHKCASAATAQY